jgi:SNF2 family DNA or RNA helicase
VSLTDYHAKYFAHELTKRCSSDSVGKLAASLADAQVDLNPHQVDAALFAFRSPLSKGAILADEVGLGKTIEAGILLSQKWAEQKRRLLIIVPANLRKQWSQELADKFFLPSVILEAKSFNQCIAQGNLNPFDQSCIVICSYQFVRSKQPYVQKVDWNLVVIDEAHRLRNVYKPTNKIANAIKTAVASAPKVLLTATPLQNSLLELYGLVSIVDEYTFGDLKSFKAQFSRISGDSQFQELKQRISPICQRTLRRQVLEYVPYTDRIAITQEFYPTEQEQRLYDLVSGYLQRESLYALPTRQRKLMTLILRKLLGSSTYAISGTLQGLSEKLSAAAVAAKKVEEPPQELTKDFEVLDELEDEWEESEDEEEDDSKGKSTVTYTAEQIEEMHEEVATLKEFSDLAKSISHNSKGGVLLTALHRGFDEARRRGSSEKAIIFTESRRTQEYLLKILEQTEYAGKIVLFNGTNTDPQSKSIYESWLARHGGTDRVSGSPTADKRAALVDFFRDEAVIMIATEAAAEGINLQFCSLVVNYDLPWNPQRIEQRIGRCHRYGQKHDVVVVNFLNKKNAADVRIYELLEKKFQLFSGVFGASDEVLGAIESGVDFEKRIVDIYQKCRTVDQIEFEFDALRDEMEEQIEDKMTETRQRLLEHFDEEVQEKLRIQLKKSSETLSRYEQWLWLLTKHFLKDIADFSDEEMSFQLSSNPFPKENIHLGPYKVGKNVQEVNIYRSGHPLAQKIVNHYSSAELDLGEVVFEYSGTGRNIAAIDPLLNQHGWLLGRVVTVDSFETQDHILLAGLTDSGESLSLDQCQRLFTLGGKSQRISSPPPSSIQDSLQRGLSKKGKELLDELSTINAEYFEKEIDRLDRWGEDRRSVLKLDLKELEEKIKEVKRSARLISSLPERLKMERERKMLEAKRDSAWKDYEMAARQTEKEKDSLIDDVEKRLHQNVAQKDLFTLRWHLK